MEVMAADSLAQLVNNLPPTPGFFWELRILKDFKSFVFETAHFKGVMGAFCGSAHSKGVSRKWAVIRGRWSVRRETSGVSRRGAEIFNGGLV